MATPALEVTGLGRRYGERWAVRELSLRVEAGEAVGLCGVNGAGKTTTLRLCAGALRPDGGRVLVDGHDLAAAPLQARARLGHLADGSPLPADARVEDYLRFRARLKGLGRAQTGRAVAEGLARCGLEAERRTLCGQLSRGYRQRVGLADALLGEPALLLLDEPTSGLDPVQVRELRQLLGALRERCALLLSSHALHEVEAVCSRVLVLHEGVLVAEGAPGTLRRQGARRRVVVTVRGGGEAALACLRGLPGVAAVELRATEGPLASLAVEGDGGGAELGEQVAAAVHGAGLGLLELRGEAHPLEETLAALGGPGSRP